jgi:hypothetical protein
MSEEVRCGRYGKAIDTYIKDIYRIQVHGTCYKSRFFVEYSRLLHVG